MTSTTMRCRLARLEALGATVALVLLSTGPAPAEQVIFTINPNLSSFSLSGADATYGPFQGQSPGSLTAPLTGHFLVDFDPLAQTPPTIQLIGGHGYYEPTSPYLASPGIGGSGPPALANVAGQTAGGEFAWAYRNLVWDFNSAALTGANGLFPGDTTYFNVTKGSVESGYTSPAVSGSSSLVSSGYTSHMTTGNWTLSESSSGSGDWTGAGSCNYYYTYNTGITHGTASAAPNVISTAHFGTANIAPPVAPTDTHTAVDGWEVFNVTIPAGGDTAIIDVNPSGTLDVAPTVFVKGARYDKLMEAFGGLGVHATTPAELRKAMEEAIRSRKPTLINAVIDESAGTESGRITSLNPTAKKK